jgi:hypothetical protein
MSFWYSYIQLNCLLNSIISPLKIHNHFYKIELILSINVAVPNYSCTIVPKFINVLENYWPGTALISRRSGYPWPNNGRTPTTIPPPRWHLIKYYTDSPLLYTFFTSLKIQRWIQWMNIYLQRKRLLKGSELISKMPRTGWPWWQTKNKKWQKLRD